MSAFNPATNFFLSMATKKDVALFLGLPLNKISYLIYVIEKPYIEFEIKKRDNNKRTISAPIPPLKALQKKIADVLLDIYQPRGCVYGYVRGRGIIENARVHRNQRYVIKIDLKDFFPSINFGRVRGLFLAPPFSLPDPVATLVAQICCHNNCLPQGAPSSPIISNLICRGLDRQLLEIAKKSKCFYSRYADDIVFSTAKKCLPHEIVENGSADLQPSTSIKKIIDENGFSINDEKFRVLTKSNRQIVTGLVVNDIVNVKREYAKQLRAMLFSWEKFGYDAASQFFLKFDKKNRWNDPENLRFDLIVRGRVEYIGSVKGWDSNLYNQLAAKLSILDPQYKANKSKKAHKEVRVVRLFTEGKTDILHFLSAFKFFRSKGEYHDFEISTEKQSTFGSTEVIKICDGLKEQKQQNPCIFIFDSDEPNITKKVLEDGGGYKDWGNNVFSFALPSPAHRGYTDQVCIEMYFTDELLKKKSEDGRRIFLRSEFNKTNGFHNTDQLYCTHPKSSSLIVDNDVFEVSTQKNIALSKNDFANYIFFQKPPFENPDFSAFKLVFDTIRRILDESIGGINCK